MEMIEIVRRLWVENGVSFDGEIFEVHHASLEPKLEYPLPILYGGPSRRAARIAACHADGWLAGTVPLAAVDARLSYMRELLGSIDRLFLSATPRTILDEDRERVQSRVPARPRSCIFQPVTICYYRPCSALIRGRSILLPRSPEGGHWERK